MRVRIFHDPNGKELAAEVAYYLNKSFDTMVDFFIIESDTLSKFNDTLWKDNEGFVSSFKLKNNIARNWVDKLIVVLSETIAKSKFLPNFVRYCQRFPCEKSSKNTKSTLFFVTPQQQNLPSEIRSFFASDSTVQLTNLHTEINNKQGSRLTTRS